MTRYIFLFCFFIALSSCDSGPEPELILNEGEIMDDLHQQNLGRIVFMGDYIPYDSFLKKDMLKTFDLSGGTDFNARMFLGKTLSYYLHQLAPQKTINEVCNNGNFQFKFYIDGKLQFEHNLPKGAGSSSNKNQQIVYGIPMINAKGIDHWGRFLWMKFMKLGKAESILSQGNHQVDIEVRPYLEIDELIVGDIIAEGGIQIVSEAIEVDESQKQIQEIAENSGWEVADQTYDTQKIIELNTKIAQSLFKELSSIVVIKNGQLALEEYFNGSDRNSLHDTRSVGKSFASALTGIGIEQKWLSGTDTKLSDIYDLKAYKNYSEEKANIKIEDLLTMNSLLAASDRDPNSAGQEEKMYESRDWEQFVLDLDVKSEEEKAFDYNSASAALMGAILHKLSPNGLEALAAESLFEPLGIKDYKWQFTPTRVANTAGSLRLKSLDLAKFGQLYLQEGNWKGNQILSKEWVDQSLQGHVKTNSEGSDSYGYFFWNKMYELNGQSYSVSFASGNGGNQILIFHDIPLVIVITATAYGEPWAHFQTDQIVQEYLLPAFLNVQ